MSGMIENPVEYARLVVGCDPLATHLGVEPGRRLDIALPPDRLRVFAA